MALIFKASAPNVQSNGSPAFCQVTTHGDMGCTGDVYQNSPANGLVKALVYVDPAQPSGNQIVRCFNSTVLEPTASTPPCGFTFNYFALGQHQIDFGFTVNNRFIQGTAVWALGDASAVGLQLGAFGSNSILDVATYYIGAASLYTDTPFYLTVF